MKRENRSTPQLYTEESNRFNHSNVTPMKLRKKTDGDLQIVTILLISITTFFLISLSQIVMASPNGFSVDTETETEIVSTLQQLDFSELGGGNGNGGPVAINVTLPNGCTIEIMMLPGAQAYVVNAWTDASGHCLYADVDGPPLNHNGMKMLSHITVNNEDGEVVGEYRLGIKSDTSGPGNGPGLSPGAGVDVILESVNF